VVLIRKSGASWHEPQVSAYTNEKELQKLVKLSPTLLPGDSALAVVDELPIPGVGSADLVGVAASGDLTIVECKLVANPEIRREVVGQVLAYAGGLWRMTYDAFAAAFAARASKPLPVAIHDATGEELDEGDLRTAVAQRLDGGDFRLIVAVDAITPELKLIIEYLNTHTIASVGVLALELAYSRDGDFELLVPAVYGEELSRQSPRPPTNRWTEQSFAEQVQGRTAGPVLEFIERLLAHGSQHGHHPYYGTGATPGMSYYYDIEGHPVSVWALHLRDTPAVALSLGAMSKPAPEATASFIGALKTNAALARALADIDEQALHKYPNIPIPGVLDNAATQTAFFDALNDLVGEPFFASASQSSVSEPVVSGS